MTETKDIMNGLNNLKYNQKVGLVLMILLITYLYPQVVIMIGLTIGVVYVLIHRKQEQPQQIETKVETIKTVDAKHIAETKNVKFCSNCGEVLFDFQKFCSGCGQKRN